LSCETCWASDSRSERSEQNSALAALVELVPVVVVAVVVESLEVVVESSSSPQPARARSATTIKGAKALTPGIGGAGIGGDLLPGVVPAD
jgi:hypothetical protein